jgi:hypothetical protein
MVGDYLNITVDELPEVNSMSVSQAQLDHFAKFVMTHEAMPIFRERVQKGLFDRFRTATAPEREVINAIMDNETLFFDEVKKVMTEMTSKESVNDEVEKPTKKNK